MVIVLYDPTTDTEVMSYPETAEEPTTSADPATSASVPEPSAAFEYSSSVDSRFYLSEDTGNYYADMLLSIRNILLLWFLCWAIFKMNNKIHNGVKAMLGRSDKH